MRECDGILDDEEADGERCNSPHRDEARAKIETRYGPTMAWVKKIRFIDDQKYVHNKATMLQ
jgi:hypothetical protein